jgi:hypothetical protein
VESVRQDGVSEEPESEEGVDSQAEEDRIQRKEAKRMDVGRTHEDHFRSVSSFKHHYHHHHHHQKLRSVPYVSSIQKYAGGAPPSPSGYRHHLEGRSSGGGGSRPVRLWDEELDAEGELDGGEGDYLDDERLRPFQSMNRGRPWPIGLADLHSPSGR